MNVRDLLQGWTQAVEQATLSIEQNENVDLENVAGLRIASNLQAGGIRPDTFGRTCILVMNGYTETASVCCSM